MAGEPAAAKKKEAAAVPSKKEFRLSRAATGLPPLPIGATLLERQYDTVLQC